MTRWALVLVCTVVGGVGAPLAAARGLTTAPAVEAAIAQAVTAGRPVVLEFTADWCGPCRVLQTTLSAPELRARLACAEVIVVDLTPGARNRATLDLTARFRVEALPTVAFLDREGFEQGARLAGVVPAPALQQRLAEVC